MQYIVLVKKWITVRFRSLVKPSNGRTMTMKKRNIVRPSLYVGVILPQQAFVIGHII